MYINIFGYYAIIRIIAIHINTWLGGEQKREHEILNAILEKLPGAVCTLRWGRWIHEYWFRTGQSVAAEQNTVAQPRKLRDTNTTIYTTDWECECCVLPSRFVRDDGYAHDICTWASLGIFTIHFSTFDKFLKKIFANLYREIF